jgi:hypothetical protein
MSLASNNPTNTRLLTDTEYLASCSLQTSLSTSGFDFIQASPYPTTEQVIVRMNTSTITSTLVGGVTGSFRLQDSANNSSYSNISELAGYTLKGTSLTATSQDVLLPPSVRRYIRSTATFTDSGSNSTTNYTGSISCSVFF